jgi:hypothetical protein
VKPVVKQIEDAYENDDEEDDNISAVFCNSLFLAPHMKLRKFLTANRRISNKKFRMMKCGIASL